MNFNSVDYLIFFPIVVLLYFVMPVKLRNLWLLLASYFFYMHWNVAYGLLLFSSSLVTYAAGLLIEKARAFYEGDEVKKVSGLILVLDLVFNLGLLFFFKYANFMIGNINRISSLFGGGNIRSLDILLPVGISFYIFQALGYTIDVYRNEVKAEKNIITYMLFVSFFPQLVAGPIERSRNLLPQFKVKHEFDVDRVREGLFIMATGLFMKIMIADNIATYVDAVYENYMGYTGAEIMLATILFAFQIYCDFGGYSAIAIGSAKVLGFNLMENFHSPYLATSIRGFWRRWHISLTGWFRDYLYIPLGGNRKGKIRKHINTFIVFFISGMWHGAAWNYIAWGVINGIYLIVEEVSEPLRNKIMDKCRVDKTRFSFKLGSGLITFALVDLSWLFFRARGIGNAFSILKQMITAFQGAQFFGLAFNRTGFSVQLTVTLIVAFILLLISDVLKEKGTDLWQVVNKQGAWFRWGVYLLILFMIMMYGAYGLEYAQTEFIYFQF